MSSFAERMAEYREMEKEREVWDRVINFLRFPEDPHEEIENPTVERVIAHITEEILLPMEERMAVTGNLEVADGTRTAVTTKSEPVSRKKREKAADAEGGQPVRRPIRFRKPAGKSSVSPDNK